MLEFDNLAKNGNIFKFKLRLRKIIMPDKLFEKLNFEF